MSWGILRDIGMHSVALRERSERESEACEYSHMLFCAGANCASSAAPSM